MGQYLGGRGGGLSTFGERGQTGCISINCRGMIFAALRRHAAILCSAPAPSVVWAPVPDRRRGRTGGRVSSAAGRLPSWVTEKMKNERDYSYHFRYFSVENAACLGRLAFHDLLASGILSHQMPPEPQPPKAKRRLALNCEALNLMVEFGLRGGGVCPDWLLSWGGNHPTNGWYSGGRMSVILRR